jgi:CelD/BcsL family acetyltransferase involved in cellulose biosynthesis
VRRLERRLVRDHGLAFRVTDDRARLAADLDALVRLHAARWAGTGTGTVAFAGRRLAFHRTFAERALEQGWLRLWLAEVDGRAIAAMYCLRIGDCDWYYQAGRDPAWDRHRVGFVLLARTIRAAFDDGMRAYRFGLGDEAYKARFAETDPGLRTVLLGDRLVTGLGAAAAAAARRLPAQARRAIGRIAA